MHRYDSVLPRDAEKRVYFKSFKLTSHMLSSQIAHAIKSKLWTFYETHTEIGQNVAEICF